MRQKFAETESRYKASMKFYELDGEQKLDAIIQIALIEERSEESVLSEIEDGYSIDDSFIFEPDGDGGISVIQK
jgi:hypothetical protein